MGLHGTPRPAGPPVIGSPEAAGQALGDLFLANADRGDDAANDQLVTELVRRIRAQQDSRDGGRGQQPPDQPATTAQVPAPQFGNSPDSGRPPIEQSPRPIPAPGGRPDTTTPLSIDRCVHLPVTSVDPVTGPSPKLTAPLMLDRAHGTPRPTSLRVPAPQFPTRASAPEQPSGPEPLAALAGGEANPGGVAGEPGAGPLRWARCPDDGRLHLLQPADVVVAATGLRAEALCGRLLPTEGLTLGHGWAGALCTGCLAAPIGC